MRRVGVKFFAAIAVMTCVLGGIAKADEICFPPIAEYYNYWSGEQLTETDLEGAKWDVAETKMVINLRDKNELPTYLVYISHFDTTTTPEPVFFVEGFQYSREELELELDAGHFDEP